MDEMNTSRKMLRKKVIETISTQTNTQHNITHTKCVKGPVKINPTRQDQPSGKLNKVCVKTSPPPCGFLLPCAPKEPDRYQGNADLEEERTPL